jgi:hypothetical protein
MYHPAISSDLFLENFALGTWMVLGYLGRHRDDEHAFFRVTAVHMRCDTGKT